MLKAMYFIFIFGIISFSYSQEDLVYFPVSIAQNNPQYKEIKERYGNLWISIKRIDQNFITGTGKDRFIVESAHYYFKQNDKYIILGSIDRNGLYDKEGKIIFEINIKQSEKLGLSSKLLESPFAPSIVIKTKDGLIKETNAIILIELELNRDSISIFTPDL